MGAPLRLLVRSWVSDKGCVYQRSTSLPETEALELLEAARGSIEKAQESGTIEEIPLPNGRAFVQARRSPDPDQPNRTAPGFVLVSIPDPDAFLRDVIAHEFDILFRSAAHMTLDEIRLPTEGDPGKSDWKLMDLGKPLTSSTSKHLMGTKSQKKAGLVALILLIVSLLAMSVISPYLARIRQTSPSIGGRAPTRSSVPDNDPDQEENNWEEARKQIRKVLVERGVMQTEVDDSTRNEDNRKLLSEFAKLFQRPDMQEELKTDFENYAPRKPIDHPFVAFMSRLLERIPDPPGGEAVLTSSEAWKYLQSLSNDLKTQKPFHIDLELNRPEMLADRVNFDLNYDQFFKDQTRTSSSSIALRIEWDKADPYDNKRDNDAAYRWVKRIRSLIEDRYSREIRRQ
jgi:hypothetical protein